MWLHTALQTISAEPTPKNVAIDLGSIAKSKPLGVSISAQFLITRLKGMHF